VGANVAATGTVSKPMVRVTTELGRQIDVTVDHPFWAIESGYPTRHRELVRGPGQWVEAAHLDPARHSVKVALDYQTEARHSWESPLGWLAGIAIGDGSVSRRDGMFAISTGCDAVRDRIAAVAHDHLSTTTAVRTTRSRAVDVFVHRGAKQKASVVTEAAAFIDALEMRGKSAHTKTVPEFVEAGGDEFVAAFIAGYLDADGTVTENAVVWSSVSRELLEGVQRLLARLGVQSSIRTHTAAGQRIIGGRACNAASSYVLKVASKRGTAILASVLDCAEPAKAARLAVHADPSGHQRSDAFFEFDRVKTVTAIPTRQATVIEVEGMHTHVTAGLVTHNSGIEQQGIGFVTYTLRNWISRLEHAYGRYLLMFDDPAQARFDTSDLTRGDLKTQAEFWMMMRVIGALNVDEIRGQQGLAPLPNRKGQTYIDPTAEQMMKIGASGKLSGLTAEPLNTGGTSDGAIGNQNGNGGGPGGA